jgi:hypothetical protein
LTAEEAAHLPAEEAVLLLAGEARLCGFFSRETKEIEINSRI